MIDSLKGMRIGIVGAARSGIGASRLVHRLGGKALISDIRNPDALREAAVLITQFGFEMECAEHRRIIEEPFDLIILSPGVIPNENMMNSWRQAGSEIISELEFASRCTESTWVGVTGSNGKTTTCHLLKDILNEAGKTVQLVGNIGSPWSAALPASDDTVFVVEVSSFQLEFSPTVKPTVAVILNIHENHLDRHASLEEYADLKFRLTANQKETDYLVVNADDRQIQLRSHQSKAIPVLFGKDQGHDWRVLQDSVSCFENGVEIFSIQSNEIPLLGFHNRMNAAAAAAAARSLLIDFAPIERALRNAAPVEHRLEFVRELNSVRYINDSKSTNMVATAAAVESLAAPMILLFGGRPKKESFRRLNEFLESRVRHLIVFGEARPTVFREIVNKSAVSLADNLAEALKTANSMRETGDTILLSPGCASFDQFDNFERRGEYFKSLVLNL